MGEYIAGVVAVSVMLGAVGSLSYPGASDKIVKSAVAVLLLYCVAVPGVKLVEGLSEVGFSGIDTPSFDVELSGGAYENVGKEAFLLGTKKLIMEKYNISAEEISVSAEGFDFQNMRADKIKILLSGGAVAKDYFAIEQYVRDIGLGECEVNIRIG